MADESHKAEMKTRWTGPCTIGEVNAEGIINQRTNMGILIKWNFPPANQVVLPRNAYSR